MSSLLLDTDPDPPRRFSGSYFKDLHLQVCSSGKLAKLATAAVCVYKWGQLRLYEVGSPLKGKAINLVYLYLCICVGGKPRHHHCQKNKNNLFHVSFLLPRKTEACLVPVHRFIPPKSTNAG